MTKGSKPRSKSTSARRPVAKRGVRSPRRHLAAAQAQVGIDTRELAAQLEVINSIQHGLATRLDIQAIYDLVGDKIREIFNAQAVLIASYEADGTRIVGRYLVEKGQRFYPNAGGAEITPFHRRFVKRGSTLFLSRNANAELEKLGANTIAGTEPVRSAVFVPLSAGDRALGMLSLQDVDRDDAFSESDVRLLETIAGSMGVALENAHLFDEVQKSNRALSEALQQQTATTEVLRALSGSQTALKSLLEIIAVNAAKVCNADDAHIYRVEGETLKEWTHRGPIPGLEEGEWLPLNRESIIGRAVLEREPVHIRDAAEDLDEREYPVSAALQRRWGTHSIMAVPLLRDGRSIGGIAIRRREVRPFTEEEIALLSTFADQAVIAIENTRLFEGTTHLLRQAEQRAAELAIINNVQRGLASKLELQGIHDLVGDTVREIFGANTVVLTTFDQAQNVMQWNYVFEKGRRLSVEPRPIAALWQAFIGSRQSLLVNDHLREFVEQREAGYVQPVGEMPKSALIVPLVMQGEVRGAISLQNVDRENAFTESDQRLLETLAGSMSVALENARLFDETQRLLKETEQRVAELSLINSVQQGLASKLEIQEVYDAVGDTIRGIFSVHTVSIVSCDEEAGTLTDRYSWEKGDRTLVPGVIPLFGIRKHVVETKKSMLIVKDAEHFNKMYDNPILLGAPSKSAVFVPILLGARVTGVVSLQDMDREGAFTDSDVRLLETLASSMSVALENARLFDETQRLLKETEQRAAELAIINSVQEGLASNLDMQAIYELVGSKIQEIFRADTVSIVMHDALEDTLTARYYYEGGQRRPLPGAIRSFGFRERVLETRKPLVVNRDVEDLAKQYVNPVYIGGMPKSCVFVPMLVGERVTGIVSLQDMGREDAYTDADVRLLTTLANSMSVALENARLYEEARHARMEAEQANRAKSAFLANMSHELRTPLNAIIGFTRIVRRRGQEALPPKQLENLDKVLVSAEHLLGLINTVLDIAKIEAGRMDVMPANFRLEALFDLCLNTTQPMLRPGVALEKQMDESLNVVYSDQDKLRQIVLNLLSNAAKFTSAGRILLAAQRLEGDRMRISVNDTGIGIAADDLPRVFQEFQQADNSTTRQYGGTGLGLTISRDLAHLLGGDLTAESEPGRGATFALTIPMHYGTAAAQAEPSPASSTLREG